MLPEIQTSREMQGEPLIVSMFFFLGGGGKQAQAGA